MKRTHKKYFLAITLVMNAIMAMLLFQNCDSSGPAGGDGSGAATISDNINK